MDTESSIYVTPTDFESLTLVSTRTNVSIDSAIYTRNRRHDELYTYHIDRRTASIIPNKTQPQTLLMPLIAFTSSFDVESCCLVNLTHLRSLTLSTHMSKARMLANILLYCRGSFPEAPLAYHISCPCMFPNNQARNNIRQPLAKFCPSVGRAKAD